MNKVILLLIILIASFLRLYQLDINPPSLNWDEVSHGYNAYSILKTGADEYGNKLPISIRSFGDYKAPLYEYLIVPSIYFFGLNEFSVRFPNVLFGALSVFIIFFLVCEILQAFSKKNAEQVALLSAFFLAISPWHLQFSRYAHEGTLGLFFFILGLLLFFKGIKNFKILIFSSLSFILSIYSYHSFRLLVPLTFILMGIFFYKDLIKKWQIVFISIMVFAVFASPIYLGLLTSQESSSRLSMVTIFGQSESLAKSSERLIYDKETNNNLRRWRREKISTTSRAK